MGVKQQRSWYKETYVQLQGSVLWENIKKLIQRDSGVKGESKELTGNWGARHGLY